MRCNTDNTKMTSSKCTCKCVGGGKILVRRIRGGGGQKRSVRVPRGGANF